MPPLLIAKRTKLVTDSAVLSPVGAKKRQAAAEIRQLTAGRREEAGTHGPRGTNPGLAQVRGAQGHAAALDRLAHLRWLHRGGEEQVADRSRQHEALDVFALANRDEVIERRGVRRGAVVV